MNDSQKPDEIEAKILAICTSCLRELHPDKEIALTPDSSLIRDAELDSLQAIEMISEIESGCGVLIPSEALPEIDTIRDIARIVRSSLKAKSGGAS